MLQQMRSLAKYVWLLVALALRRRFSPGRNTWPDGPQRRSLTTTAVAVVNGHEIMYRDYMARAQNELQSAAAAGRTDAVLGTTSAASRTACSTQWSAEVLLGDEYRPPRNRRHRTTKCGNSRQALRRRPGSRTSPPSKREGRFDPQKYARLLAQPPGLRQSGLARCSSKATIGSEIPAAKSCSIRSRRAST